MNEPTKSKGIHVLLVDDEAQGDIASCLRSYRGYSGLRDGVHLVEHNEQVFCFHLETHTTRAHRTVKFGLHPIDAVVIDVYFEGQDHDGLWLLHGLSNMAPDIPSIVLTARPDFDLAHTAGRRSADAFVTKNRVLSKQDPDRVEKLLRELTHQIERKRNQPELHDRAHLSTAEAYADEGYDEEEWSFPGTAAYYMFENRKIIELVERLRKEGRQVRICDIGCGTGRIEELLLGRYDLARDGLQITAVDFAGRMLKRLADKNLHDENGDFLLVRGSAERLSLLEDSSFDLVILGFGVPSYTRYHYTLAEAARLCRPNGFGLFSVYNAQSVAYDAQDQQRWKPEERPVAATTDRETGKLDVAGKYKINCETFTVDTFGLLLRRNGFAPGSDTEGFPPASFPTLLASLDKAEVEKMSDVERSVTLVGNLSHECTFSPALFRQDLALSRAIGNRGHYIVFCARRSGAEEV